MRKSGIVIVLMLLAGLLEACGGGGGGGVGGGGGGGVIPPRARYAYVANESSSDISAYQIKVATGALARIDCAGAGCNGSDFAAGTGPASVTVDPGGAFAYVANTGSNDVSAYQITAASGALTRIDCGAGIGCNGSNFAAGTGPVSVTVDPSGAFAYVVNTGSNDVSAYQITAASGALTRIDCGAGAGCNGIDFAAGTSPASITVDPSGAFAYVANTGSDDVSAYQITAASGALTRIDCGAGAGCNDWKFAAGTGPASVTVVPGGAFAYVANKFSNDVSAYQITAASGALTRIDCGAGAGCNGSDFAAGTGPASVAVDPSGAFAYVANRFSNDVSAYQITAASGALTRIDCGAGAGCNGSDFAAGTGPASVTVAPNGAFAYVANTGSDDVSAYQIMAGSGVLTRTDCVGVAGCSGSNFAAGTGPASVITTR